MALNTRGSVDPRWIYHNRKAAAGLNLAQVIIYNPASDSQEYDATTNMWTGTYVTLFEGAARVQPFSAGNSTGDTYNPTVLENVRVQIAYNSNSTTGASESMPDIRPNDKMRVTSSPYNPTLQNFIYVVTNVMNSSNAWERTLLCRVDTELDTTVMGV